MIAYIALFSALLSRLTALACDSTGMTCFFIARFFFFFSETYGIMNYGSGWRMVVVNQCLEFVLFSSVMTEAKTDPENEIMASTLLY